tara:strand:- start:729 stop:1388 length:660 start_codon:yes stop_codon:yes gene_type:complete
MSNYTIAVNWAGKNGLSDSDAAKVISGSDFNSEFTAVRTAVNSKADLNGSATEDFIMDNGTAATQSAGDNTTKVATTAFVTAAVAALNALAIGNIIYPVGSIYTNMAVATNPASLLGFGTWVAFAEGRVLVGKASSGTFDTLNENLGAETHTLSVAELPAHTHTRELSRSYYQGNANGNRAITTTEGNTANGDTGSTGSGTAHSNLQPSVTVHMWKRTA